jgi:drug/metabolite transporter (DMT)-like permease
VPSWDLSVLESLKATPTKEKRISAGKAATMAALVFIGVFFVTTGLQGENSWASLITGAPFVVAAMVIYRRSTASN